MIARARRAADISSWPRGPGPRATRRHPAGPLGGAKSPAGNLPVGGFQCPGAGRVPIARPARRAAESEPASGPEVPSHYSNQ